MISLIHPSRSRPKKAKETQLKWWGKEYIKGKHFEHVLSLDVTDPHLGDYWRYFDSHDTIIVNDNKSVVDATNAAAKKATGDILVYLSDDFDCPNGWLHLIHDEFSKYSGPTLVKVDDCLQHFNVAVLTIPMMSRSLYEKLNYFWHPDYLSMFVDCDLYHTTQKIGALKFAPHLKFPHNHVSIGKAENDETYRRSAANWNQGQEVFNRRKAAGFPV